MTSEERHRGKSLIYPRSSPGIVFAGLTRDLIKEEITDIFSKFREDTSFLEPKGQITPWSVFNVINQ